MLALLLLLHVGSPDVFHEGQAGPYRLLVTIRPPAVIPGVAEIQVRAAGSDRLRVRVVPLPMSGPGAKFAPTPDVAQPSPQDPQFFTASLWMMQTGSWKVRVEADGPRGRGELAVPVPAVAMRTAGMQAALGATLFALMALLSAGAVGIVGAAAREASLEPGRAPDRRRRVAAWAAMAAAAVIVVGLLYLGNAWWTSEARSYAGYVYKPLGIAPFYNDGVLGLQLQDPGWLGRRTDDLIPDHGHLMHLFVVRLPGMDRIWHLHPELTEPGRFAQRLPDTPAGRYRLYGDVVHANGFPETVTAEFALPEVKGRPLEGDDSAGAGPAPGKAAAVAELSGGYRMIWERAGEPLRARRTELFRFRIQAPDGRPAESLELYMGMPGHAAFVRRDGSVFAHVHPSGSAPMAALNLAQPAADPHRGHAFERALPDVVSFPYGFPEPGDYRIFVQVKRAGRIETGVFDAVVH